jgi:hypothetical protein
VIQEANSPAQDVQLGVRNGIPQLRTIVLIH